jgi:penicillin amidase
VKVVRLAARLFLGRRLPTTSGELTVSGLRRPITIRRDGWGIPHIDADNDHDAWFGLGFCQGQDRSFQLEALLRVVRGTLAELVGKRGLAVDRLSRRVGFYRAAREQEKVLADDVREVISGFTAGVTAAARHGLTRPAHEFALLGGGPTPWTVADVLGMMKLQSFLLVSNWDSELTRLKILLEDGPEALAALDPTYPAHMHVTAPYGQAAGEAVDRLARDLSAFTALVRPGGGSNNWAVAGSRTATGRPLLADDPHLAPLLPPHWYLAHVRTPRWALAGASFAGAPGIPAGHNGFAAWGMTAGLVDNTDLFLEEIGPDGRSVKQGDSFVPCAVVREEIAVRNGRPVVEEVLVTPRGPVVSPAFRGDVPALSLRATWLDPLPVRGFLGLHLVRSWDEFRAAFAEWPAPTLNMAYADETGRIGWQLAGRAPVRRKGEGLLPLPGWDPEAGWEAAPVPFDQMPHAVDPPRGFIATANTRPLPEGEGPYLGGDWVDGYRLGRILEVLDQRSDWDIAATQELQRDLFAGPWREMRDAVLAATSRELPEEVAEAQAMLRAWDGRLTESSRAALLYELFVSRMVIAVARAKAPKTWTWAVGRGHVDFMPFTLFAVRRIAHLAGLLRRQPAGWFERSWPEEIGFALGRAFLEMGLRSKADGSRGWGQVRTLTLKHPLGELRALGWFFNLGPVPLGGDHTTPAQGATIPMTPLANPGVIASLRMVVDVGAWSNSRFALPGGQSGNPLSPHYADQLETWRHGEGVPIAWTDEDIAAATRETLRLNSTAPLAGASG